MKVNASAHPVIDREGYTGDAIAESQGPTIEDALGELGLKLAAAVDDDTDRVEVTVEIERPPEHPSLTQAQQLAAMQAVASVGSTTGGIEAVHLHIADAGEMEEPAMFGYEAVPHNSGTVAYPVAALLIVSRDDLGHHDTVSLLDADGGTLAAWERH